MTTKKIYYDGNVGIGTNAPTDRLTIKGSTATDAVLRIIPGEWNSAGDYGEIKFGPATDNNHYIRGEYSRGLTFYDLDKFTFSGGDLRLQKDHRENNTPSWEKHILFTDELDRVGARITGKRETWGGAPMGLSFHTGGVNTVTERMTIKSDGRVGIGTASPSAKLEINGNIKVHTAGARELHLKNGRNGDSTIGSSGGWLRVNSNGLISFWVNGRGESDDSPQVRFENNGVISCGGTVQMSDAKWKKEVKTIDNALDKVSELRGVNYKWNEAHRGDRLQMGLVAQEVEKILPELVYTDEKGDKSVAYSNLTALLIEAVKELSEKLAKLQSAPAA